MATHMHMLAHRGDVGDLRSQARSVSTTTASTGNGAGRGVENANRFSKATLGVAGVEKSVPPRRLIVGCDGTWLNSDSTPTIPSNVTRICRALSTSESNTPTLEQIVFYHRGIGTEGDLEDKYLVGTTGSSLCEHVRQCYGFLVNNWREGDEIFLFGFSRGSYTARAISALISDVGLLNAFGMEFFYEIFTDWMNQNLVSKSPIRGSVTTGVFKGMGSRPVMPSREYREALLAKQYTRTPIPIKVVGVFDTVGALGVPPVMGLHLSDQELLQFSFVNTKVPQAIKHAFQSLGLDEHRNDYSPCLWEWPSPPDSLQTLRQVWFPGVHCNIGGSGYEDEGLSHATLAWMVSRVQETEAQPMLDFDEKYLRWVFQQNIQNVDTYYTRAQTAASDKHPTDGDDKDHIGPLGFRGWGMGRMEETDIGIYKVTGERRAFSTDSSKSLLERLKEWWDIGDTARTPGRYDAIDAFCGVQKDTGQRLRATGERIHRSARTRVALLGRGLLDQPEYQPMGLKGVNLVGDGLGIRERGNPIAEGWRWVGQGMAEDGGDMVLEEEELGRFERVYLQICDDSIKAKVQ